MVISRGKLSDVFGIEVTNFGVLPQGFGLGIQVPEGTGLGKVFKSRLEPTRSGRRVAHFSQDVWELTRDHGVVVVYGGDASSILQNMKSSGKRENGGLALQDFWHWDSQADGSLEETAIALHKPKMGDARENGTVYATERALRRAMKKVDLDSFGLQGKEKDAAAEALNIMSENGYSFSLMLGERHVRDVVTKHMPTLMAQMKAQMPADQVFELPWQAGNQAVVFHYNSILCPIKHGRVHGKDADDVLESFMFTPT